MDHLTTSTTSPETVTPVSLQEMEGEDEDDLRRSSTPRGDSASASFTSTIELEEAADDPGISNEPEDSPRGRDRTPSSSEPSGSQSEVRQSGIRDLKLTLQGLERFFVFDKYSKSEEKKDGKYTRVIHTGKAQCKMPGCNRSYSFTTQSRAHLRGHYEKMHKEKLPVLAAALEGMSKRGRSRSGGSDRGQASKRRQLSLEENFSKDKEFPVTQEMMRKLYLRDDQGPAVTTVVGDAPPQQSLVTLYQPTVGAVEDEGPAQEEAATVRVKAPAAAEKETADARVKAARAEEEAADARVKAARGEEEAADATVKAARAVKFAAEVISTCARAFTGAAQAVETAAQAWEAAAKEEAEAMRLKQVLYKIKIEKVREYK